MHSFLHRHDEAFSTEPIKNPGKNAPLNFNHVQNLTIVMSKAFLHYTHHYPIIFEVFGHFQPMKLPSQKSNDRPPLPQLQWLLPHTRCMRIVCFLVQSTDCRIRQ